MDKYPNFWSVLLGDQPIGFLLGYIAVAMVAAIGITLVAALSKYKNIRSSPDEWSWKYFAINNGGNFLAGLIILPVFIRIVMAFIVNPNFVLLFSAGLGFGFYKLAKLANKFGVWTTDKVSEKIAEKIKTQQDGN